MKTKRFYQCPTTKVVQLKSTYHLLAGSLGSGMEATIPGYENNDDDDPNDGFNQ